MYQFSLKGCVSGEAPKLMITFLNPLKRKLGIHSKVTNLPRVWISSWLWGIISLDSALRGELRFLHPLTRAPTMVVDSMSPGGQGPTGCPGRGGQVLIYMIVRSKNRHKPTKSQAIREAELLPYFWKQKVYGKCITKWKEKSQPTMNVEKTYWGSCQAGWQVFQRFLY